eukprot:SAG31_NODE_695_length_12765_cov_6.974499_13_plen_387_part_00
MTRNSTYHRHILPRWRGPVRGHWDLAMQYSVFGQGSPDPRQAGYMSRLHTIAPEVPRSYHMLQKGALTVGNEHHTQLLDFANIRLHRSETMDVTAVDWDSVDIADVSSQSAYDTLIKEHIRASQMVECIDALWATANLHTLLTAVIPCVDDGDRACWNGVMTGRFSLFGIGLGDIPRGVYKGTVFVRWLTNKILLVAHYSPFATFLPVGYRQTDRPVGSVGRKRGGPCQDAASGAIPSAPPTGARVLLGPAGESCDVACCTSANSLRKQHFIGLRNLQKNCDTKCAVELLPLVNPPTEKMSGGNTCTGFARWKKGLAGMASFPREFEVQLKESTCRFELSFGLPAIETGVFKSAAAQILATNNRLLNCSAKPPWPSLRRICVCTTM